MNLSLMKMIMIKMMMMKNVMNMMIGKLPKAMRMMIIKMVKMTDSGGHWGHLWGREGDGNRTEQVFSPTTIIVTIFFKFFLQGSRFFHKTTLIVTIFFLLPAGEQIFSPITVISTVRCSIPPTTRIPSNPIHPTQSHL